MTKRDACDLREMKERVFSCQREKCVESELSREQKRERRRKKRERHPRNHFFVGENNYISLQNYISSFISTRGCFCATLINTRARTTFSSLSSARDADERVSAKGAALERIHTHHSLNHHGEKRILQFLTKKHERVKPTEENLPRRTKRILNSTMAVRWLEHLHARETQKRRRSRDEEWFSHGESFNPTDLGAMLMSVAGFTLPSKEEIEQSLNTFWNRWMFFGGGNFGQNHQQSVSMYFMVFASCSFVLTLLLVVLLGMRYDFSRLGIILKEAVKSSRQNVSANSVKSIWFTLSPVFARN